ncbi:hypothetical protein ACQP2P_44590 [Dactylosporangium sp. CA-139114]|uniref:hypothetical protein n=1 Tax=Dactylosporangium sp. CA-139114 TaxID=3239931 RepID=UPI003D981BA4
MVELNEHNAGDLFRAGLSPEPPRPPRVDVAIAMRDGRRRRAARRAALVGGIAVAAAMAVAVPAALALTRNESAPPGLDPTAVASEHPVNPNTGTPGPTARRSLEAPPFAEPPTSCTAHELPSPSSGGESTLVTAGSPNGKVHFGLLYRADGEKQVVRWRAGQPALLAFEGDEPRIQSVNNNGEAVGDSLVNGTETAWLLGADDQVKRLPGGEHAHAVAINGVGEVAGSRGSDGPGGRPTVWRDTGAPPVDLPLPAGATGGQVRAMDDWGSVFGSVTFGTRELPYTWAPDGTGRQLPLPPGTPTSPSGGPKPGPSSIVYDARAGWAVGITGLYSPTPRPVRWNMLTNTVEVLTGLDRATAVNGMGFTIGNTAAGRGVLLAEDQRIVLPAILNPGKDRPNTPATISDDGRTIAGQAWRDSNTFQAVVWNCH